MREAAFRPESPTDAPVPIGLFSLDSMGDNRRLSMLSLVKHWGLECHQGTPNIPAIEQLLASRYGTGMKTFLTTTRSLAQILRKIRVDLW